MEIRMTESEVKEAVAHWFNCPSGNTPAVRANVGTSNVKLVITGQGHLAYAQVQLPEDEGATDPADE